MTETMPLRHDTSSSLLFKLFHMVPRLRRHVLKKITWNKEATSQTSLFPPAKDSQRSEEKPGKDVLSPTVATILSFSCCDRSLERGTSYALNSMFASTVVCWFAFKSRCSHTSTIRRLALIQRMHLGFPPPASLFGFSPSRNVIFWYC